MKRYFKRDAESCLGAGVVTKAVKLLLLVAALLWPLFTLAADQRTLTELDSSIMRPPPFPPKWETNILSLTATAEKGDAMAQFALGSHYIFAVGTKQDFTKAIQWLKKSADQKFAPAEYSLAILYKYGLGVSTNRTTADEWFQKAANQSYIPAKHEAALTADRNGKRAEASKLLREAAENGFPSSEYLMGCIASDPMESYVWHSLAAPSIEIAGTRSLELRQTLTKDQLAECEERIRKFKEKHLGEPTAKQ